MKSLNRQYLMEQFLLIEEYLNRARSIARQDLDSFLKDGILIDASVRELTVLFETCHNIAKHIIAGMGCAMPPVRPKHLRYLQKMR